MQRNLPRIVAPLLLLLFLSPAPRAQQAEPPPEAPKSVWDEVKRLYEEAKKRGEKVPKDIYEWIRGDLDRSGDWEYRVVDVDPLEAELLEASLNELGAERWECFWVGVAGGKTRFVLKRPARTYLRNLALSDLLKLIPTGDSGGETP